MEYPAAKIARTSLRATVRSPTDAYRWKLDWPVKARWVSVMVISIAPVELILICDAAKMRPSYGIIKAHLPPIVPAINRPVGTKVKRAIGVALPASES
jgi:hypothetical protein